MKKRGVGYACIFYGTGYGNGFPDESRAAAELIEKGNYCIYVAAAEVGQGAKNVMLQIAAETLNTDIENITIINNSTLCTKDSGTAAASRQTYNTGNAVMNACRKLKMSIDNIRNLSGNLEMPLKEVYDAMKKMGISTKEEGYFITKTSALDSENGQGEPYWPYAFGVQKAVVEVDDETGKVDIIEITACHDVGKAINPAMVQAQIDGGCAMGIGFGIMEEIEFNKGKIKNTNFSNYIIPTSMDVPHINSYVIEENEESGPYGAKGLGEPTMIPTAPAIINAIYNAVGVRIDTLPAIQERIIEVLNEKHTAVNRKTNN